MKKEYNNNFLNKACMESIAFLTVLISILFITLLIKTNVIYTLNVIEDLKLYTIGVVIAMCVVFLCGNILYANKAIGNAIRKNIRIINACGIDVILFLLVYIVLYYINHNPNIGSHAVNVEIRDFAVTRVPILLLLLGITMVLFALSVALTLINVCINKGKYKRDFDKLVSPIFAETIIDGKTEVKELLMTSIVEFNVRGNVEIINNEAIKYRNSDGLKFFEKRIMDLIFESDKSYDYKEVVTFAEINEKFSKSKSSNMEFSNKMDDIKQLIREELFDEGIYSRELTTVTNIIKLMSFLIMLNAPLLFVDIEYYYSLIFQRNGLSLVLGTFLFIIMINFAAIIWISNKNLKNISINKQIIETKDKVENEVLNSNTSESSRFRLSISLGIVYMILFIGIGIRFVEVFKAYPIFIFGLYLLYVFNTFIQIVNISNILTPEGRRHKIKLQCLRNYIKDYSLMEERDVEEVILWDEYLAYSAAFEISSKVTDKIYESWYNMNMDLEAAKSVVLLPFLIY